MKPCSSNRKQIAWLVLGQLDSKSASGLRDHLAGCEGCGRYYDEISNVAMHLAPAKTSREISPTAYFQRKLNARLKQTQPGSKLLGVLALARGILSKPKFAVPAAAAAILAATWVVLKESPPAAPQPRPTLVQNSQAQNPAVDMDPTVANYQMIANQSFEKLQELLTKQGLRNPAPAPIYTASTFLHADGHE